MIREIKGKVCIVTGANRGLGKASSMGLAKMGATVMLVCRDKNRGEEALKEIQEASTTTTLSICYLLISPV